MTPTPLDAPLQRNRRERHLAWLIAIILLVVLATLALMASQRPHANLPLPALQSHHD